MTKRIFSLVFAALLAFASTRTADAAGRGPILIRDAEIETIIAGYATPLFAAAGLPDPTAVHVYLIQDNSINAFVAGGLNMFIYTGLIMKAERPNQLIGVMAHETGHMAGGHLARRQEALRAATIEAIVACVLGIGAAAGTGQGGAAGACQLGSHIGLMSLLSFTRTQEASADQAGLSFLDRTHQSARGTLEFLGILSHQEALLSGAQDPYLRTHPLTRDRMDAVADHVRRSPYSDVPDSPASIEGFKRMQAKLRGYTEPGQALRRYPETDQSIEARYARAIAYSQTATLNLKKAFALVDGLIAEEPDDPYFQELKGELLLQGAGRARDAIPYYEAAARAVPQSAVLRVELGTVLIAAEDPALIKRAIGELQEAVRLEPQYRNAWHQLAIAYGTDGQLALAALCLAEEAALGGSQKSKKQAKQQAERAMLGLPEGSPGWLRAQDIYNQQTNDDE